MLDSLARYPEVAKEDFANIVAALNQLTVSFTAWPEDQHSPSLMPLINALESRLAQSGGMNAVVPQNSSNVPAPSSPVDAPGTDHHFRARPARPGESAGPLSERTAAGLASAHRLMKTLRWDTVHELPPDVDGKTRLARRAPNHATSLSGCMPSRTGRNCWSRPT